VQNIWNRPAEGASPIGWAVSESCCSCWRALCVCGPAVGFPSDGERCGNAAPCIGMNWRFWAWPPSWRDLRLKAIADQLTALMVAGSAVLVFLRYSTSSREVLERARAWDYATARCKGSRSINFPAMLQWFSAHWISIIHHLSPPDSRITTSRSAPGEPALSDREP